MISPVFIVLLGAIVSVAGVWMQSRRATLRQNCTARTSGVVARIDKDIREEISEDEVEDNGEKKIIEEITYYPVFEYTVGDRSYAKTGSSGSNSQKFRTGQQVTVFYNPNRPEEFYVSEDKANSKFGRLMAISGVVIALLGVCLLFVD